MDSREGLRPPGLLVTVEEPEDAYVLKHIARAAGWGHINLNSPNSPYSSDSDISCSSRELLLRLKKMLKGGQIDMLLINWSVVVGGMLGVYIFDELNAWQEENLEPQKRLDAARMRLLKGPEHFDPMDFFPDGHRLPLSFLQKPIDAMELIKEMRRLAPEEK